MNYKNIILLLIFFLSSPIFLAARDTARIVTRQGTYVLTPPEQCINSTCLNGIIRIAEIAGTALAADVSAASGEAKNLNTELKTSSSVYETARSEYITAKAPYDASMAVYITDLGVHNSAVGVNNAKKPEDRSSAEVDRLNRSKASLDSRADVLDSERAVLNKKWDALQLKKSDLRYKTGAVRRIEDKLNKSLEQLKLCQRFGDSALKVSQEKKWGSYKTVNDFFGTLKIIPSIELLNGNLEQMKSWSNKIWD